MNALAGCAIHKSGTLSMHQRERNVYTTLGELDRFCDQMEMIARKGLPA